MAFFGMSSNLTVHAVSVQTGGDGNSLMDPPGWVTQHREPAHPNQLEFAYSCESLTGRGADIDRKSYGSYSEDTHKKDPPIRRNSLMYAASRLKRQLRF